MTGGCQIRTRVKDTSGKWCGTQRGHTSV